MPESERDGEGGKEVCRTRRAMGIAGWTWTLFPNVEFVGERLSFKWVFLFLSNYNLGIQIKMQKICINR